MAGVSRQKRTQRDHRGRGAGATRGGGRAERLAAARAGAHRRVASELDPDSHPTPAGASPPIRVGLEEFGPVDVVDSLGAANEVQRAGVVDSAAEVKGWHSRRRPDEPKTPKTGGRNPRKSVRSEPAPLPTIFRLGTGVGKTSTTVPSLAALMPLLALTRTLELSENLRQHIEAPRSAAPTRTRVHIGRFTPDEEAGETASTPYACKYKRGVADPLGAQRDSITQWACARGCPEGEAAVFWIALHEGRDEDAAAAHDRLVEIANAQGSDPATILPCGTITAVREEPAYQALVMCAQAYTPGAATFDDGMDRLDRLVVADESAQLFELFHVSGKDIAQWQEAIAAEATAVNEEEPPIAGADDRPERLAALREITALLEIVAVELARMRPKQWRAGRKLLDALAKIGKLAEAFMSGRGVPTTSWEIPTLRWTTGTHDIPLRAAADLGWAATYGTLQVIRGELVATVPTPLLKDVVARRRALAVLDATPHPTVRAIVAELGGKTVTAVPIQPVKVVWHSARTHGRWPLLKSRRRMATELAGVRAVRDNPALADKKGRPPVVMGHHPLITALGLDEDDAGYWGKDERGHDRWCARNLVVLGLNLRSDEAARTEWLAHRGLVWWVRDEVAGRRRGETPDKPPATLAPPDWTDRREAGGEVEVAPGVWITSPVALAKNSEIRAFMLEVLAGELIQVLGRLRAIHHGGAGLVVHVLAPPVPIAHGGYVDVTVDPDDPLGMPQTRATYLEACHLAPMIRITAAAVTLGERGIRRSRRKIDHLLRTEAESKGVGHDQYSDWLDKWGGLSLDDLRVVLAELRSRAEELTRRGAKIVGLELLASHDAAHGDDCRCTLRAAAELLASADVMPATVGVRGPP